MLEFLARRIFRLIFSLLGLTVILFALTRLTPVDPVRYVLGPQATAAQVRALRHQYGLDQPLIVQYVSYLGNALHGNLGLSLQGQRSVSADLAAYQGRLEDLDAAIEAAESVRERYELLWEKLHETPELRPHDRHAIEKRIRKLNDLGFSVDEVALEPGAPDGLVRLTLAVTTRLFHARHLERKTGIVAMENQARLLLNDLHEYAAWLEWFEGRPLGTTGPERWLRDVFRPTTQRLAEVVGPDGDIVQAYCDLLEHKWLMSERAGRDVGLEAAIESYLALGAPAPERPGGNEESPVSAPAAS